MIAEGLVTTVNADATVNLAAMGPIVVGDFESLVLRPFPTSRTYANLERSRRGIFHITDDVELLVRAALDLWETSPIFAWQEDMQGYVQTGACRWYAFEIAQWDESGERPRLECLIKQRGWLRDFWGLNRAKHAVLEAAILASRVHLLAPDDIRQQTTHLKTIVDKTAGPGEQRAWEVVARYLASALT